MPLSALGDPVRREDLEARIVGRDEHDEDVLHAEAHGRLVPVVPVGDQQLLVGERLRDAVRRDPPQARPFGLQVRLACRMLVRRRAVVEEEDRLGVGPERLAAAAFALPWAPRASARAAGRLGSRTARPSARRPDRGGCARSPSGPTYRCSSAQKVGSSSRTRTPSEATRATGPRRRSRRPGSVRWTTLSGLRARSSSRCASSITSYGGATSGSSGPATDVVVAHGPNRLDHGHLRRTLHPPCSIDSGREHDRRPRREPRRRGHVCGRAEGTAADEDGLRLPGAGARRPEWEDRGARLERRRAARLSVRRGRRRACARTGGQVPRPPPARRPLARAGGGAGPRRADAGAPARRRRAGRLPRVPGRRALARRPEDARRPVSRRRAVPRPAPRASGRSPESITTMPAACWSTRSPSRRSAARRRRCTRGSGTTCSLAAAILHDAGRTLELGRGPVLRADRGGAPARPRPARDPADRVAGRRPRARACSPRLVHAVAVHHDARAARTAEAAVLYHANQLDAVAATRPVPRLAPMFAAVCALGASLRLGRRRLPRRPQEPHGAAARRPPARAGLGSARDRARRRDRWEPAARSVDPLGAAGRDLRHRRPGGVLPRHGRRLDQRRRADRRGRARWSRSSSGSRPATTSPRSSSPASRSRSAGSRSRPSSGPRVAQRGWRPEFRGRSPP